MTSSAEGNASFSVAVLAALAVITPVMGVANIETAQRLAISPAPSFLIKLLFLVIYSFLS